MMLQLFRNIGNRFGMALRIFQIAFEPMQRNADHIAVMQFRIELTLGEFQPQPV